MSTSLTWCMAQMSGPTEDGLGPLQPSFSKAFLIPKAQLLENGVWMWKSFKWRDDLYNTALDQKIKWNEINRMSFCFIFCMYWDLINEGLVGQGKMEKLDQMADCIGNNCYSGRTAPAVQTWPHGYERCGSFIKSPLFGIVPISVHKVSTHMPSSYQIILETKAQSSWEYSSSKHYYVLMCPILVEFPTKICDARDFWTMM